MNQIGKIFYLFLLLYPVPFFGSTVIRSLPADAPVFTVQSGDNRTVCLKDMGNRLVVVFYENKDKAWHTRELKDYLKAYYLKLKPSVRKGVTLVPVIDCREAVWPVSEIWKMKLREVSALEGFTVYGDWDGSMARSYGFTAGRNYFALIDGSGTIRYLKKGSETGRDLKNLTSLLDQLVKNQWAAQKRPG